MAQILIVGAGLTGLSAAYHLEQSGFYDYTIVEHNETVGGLARSVKQDGFTFDFTGHLIHINDAYFKNFLDTVVNLDTLDTRNRKSFLHMFNTFTHFPFQMNLHGLPKEVISECIQGFVNRKKSLRSPQTFPQWVLKYFGSGIAKHFFYPYNSKILAYDLNKVHPSWTGRFVPQTTLKELIEGAIQPQAETVGYNKTFLYPKKDGIQHFCNSIEKKIINPVNFKRTVESVDIKNKVIAYTDGSSEKYEYLISTMPLKKLLGMMNEPTNSSLKNAQNKLIANAVLNFNLGINIENFSEKHWIYFPEKQFPFYRLGFWHNFSQSLVPPGHSSMYGEIAYIPGTKSEKQINNLVKKSEKAVYKLFGLSEANIATKKNLHLAQAYVIYDAWRQKNLKKVLGRLEETGVHSTGRFGAWKYSSMQEAIMDGKAAAHSSMLAIHSTTRSVVPKTRKKELLEAESKSSVRT